MVRASQVKVAVGVLAGAGWLGWLAFGREAAPEVDPALAAAVMPVVDEELDLGPWRGLLETARPELGPRWFCTEHVIEIRRTGDEVVVGLEAACDEYARDGTALLTGSGERAPKVVVLVAEADGYRVSRVEPAPDGGAFGPWVRENFSEAGAAELDRRVVSGESNAADARREFGLPADAPVRYA